jgi:ABC-type microcin C transport system duplicated ATPase subunit YejF
MRPNMQASHNDKPISKPSEDRYGIDPFAKALAASIEKMAAPEGTVIALNGPWGSGMRRVRWESPPGFKCQTRSLAIGRVLIGKPKLLVLDEPSDGIQPSIAEEIAALIARLNRTLGMTTVLIEQNIDMVASCADRSSLWRKDPL